MNNCWINLSFFALGFGENNFLLLFFVNKRLQVSMAGNRTFHNQFNLLDILFVMCPILLS